MVYLYLNYLFVGCLQKKQIISSNDYIFTLIESDFDKLCRKDFIFLYEWFCDNFFISYSIYRSKFSKEFLSIYLYKMLLRSHLFNKFQFRRTFIFGIRRKRRIYKIIFLKKYNRYLGDYYKTSFHLLQSQLRLRVTSCFVTLFPITKEFLGIGINIRKVLRRFKPYFYLSKKKKLYGK